MIAPFAKGRPRPGPQYGCRIKPSLPGLISIIFLFKMSSGAIFSISASKLSVCAN